MDSSPPPPRSPRRKDPHRHHGAPRCGRCVLEPSPCETRQHYFCAAGAIFKPPWLLCTAAEVKGPPTTNCPTNLAPPPLLMVPALLMVPTRRPVVALNTRRVAVPSVLVASILSWFWRTVYSAFVMATVSRPLRTVTVPLTVVPWREPDTATGVFTVTARALRGKVAVVAPGATETPAGSAITEGFSLAKLTSTPSAAAPLKVTVPTAGLPPNIPKRLAGATETEEMANGGTTVKRPFSVTRSRVAAIVTGVDAATAAVEMLNVAARDPAGTVTVLPPGNDAAGSLLDSVTSAPPARAGPSRETVPDTVVAPPTTNLAFRVSCTSNRGSTVRRAFSVTRW